MATKIAQTRVLVLGRKTEPVVEIVRECGLLPVEDEPDVILTWGGDGLLLGSERDWPGIPKLPLRNSRRGRRCGPHQVRDAVERLVTGDLRESRWPKIRAEARGDTLVGLNDVLVHNSRPTSGVRYRVWIDDEEFGDEIVGDGVVVATSFGSTGYYRAITGSIFRVGIGLAFNNSAEPVDHLVLPEDATILVRITRGPALAAADNDRHTISLAEDDEVVIRRDGSSAIILGLEDAIAPRVGWPG